MSYEYNFQEFMTDLKNVFALPKNWVEIESYKIYRETILIIKPTEEELKNVCVDLMANEKYFPKPTEIYKKILDLRERDVQGGIPKKIEPEEFDDSEYYNPPSHQQILEKAFSKYPKVPKNYADNAPIILWMGKTYHYSKFETANGKIDSAIAFLCSLFGITRTLAERWICLDIAGYFDNDKIECGYSKDRKGA